MVNRYSEVNFSKIYNNEPIDSLGSTFIQYIINTKDIVLYTVPRNQSYRIDLICKQWYKGRKDLFWIIYYVNSIISMEDFAEGSQLIIPSLSAIEREYIKAKDRVKNSTSEIQL